MRGSKSQSNSYSLLDSQESCQNVYLASTSIEKEMREEFSPETAARSWTHWFEIPVSDFDRAQRFYCTIFATEMDVMDFGSFKMGVFPHAEVGASLCQGEWYQPGANGPVVYMNANPDLQVVQDRIAAAGGKVLMPKKAIGGGHGYMALFLDTEGNRLALHSHA